MIRHSVRGKAVIARFYVLLLSIKLNNNIKDWTKVNIKTLYTIRVPRTYPVSASVSSNYGSITQSCVNIIPITTQLLNGQ